MYNPQWYAIRVEHILEPKGLAREHSADEIRRDPLGFMDGVLGVYERQSEDREQKSADFWDEFEHLKGTRMDDWTEEDAMRFVNCVSELFK